MALYEFSSGKNVWTKEFATEEEMWDYYGTTSDDDSTCLRKITENGIYCWDLWTETWVEVSYNEYKWRELSEIVKQYLTFASTDGKLERRPLRAKLAELVGVQLKD